MKASMMAPTSMYRKMYILDVVKSVAPNVSKLDLTFIKLLVWENVRKCEKGNEGWEN